MKHGPTPVSWIEGVSEFALLVPLQENLEAEPQGIEIYGLRLIAMRKTS